jgi:hypothetical protein
MKKVIGLMMFCVGVGMTLMLFLPMKFITILLIFLFLIGGYNLFCC